MGDGPSFEAELSQIEEQADAELMRKCQRGEWELWVAPASDPLAMKKVDPAISLSSLTFDCDDPRKVVVGPVEYWVQFRQPVPIERSDLLTTDEPSDPGAKSGVDAVAPETTEPAVARSPRRGALRGQTNRVKQERQASIPMLRDKRRSGEPYRQTIMRLVRDEGYVPPGNGDPENMVDDLARAWGEADARAEGATGR
jgi:hypothetical protein